MPVLFSSHQLELVEHICEAVAIVDRGRVVACGPVEELRAAGARRVRIEVRDAASDWIDGLTGVTLVERDGGAVVLELSSVADSQRVLDAARQAGAVTAFGESQPTLGELFRELVTS